MAYCRCNTGIASPGEQEPETTQRSQSSRWRPGWGSGPEDSLGQPRGVLRIDPEALLMVQWLRTTLQCRGCGFNPWFRGAKVPHVSEQQSPPATMTEAPEPHPESSCTPPKSHVTRRRCPGKQGAQCSEDAQRRCRH